jgi:uncharacterized protein
MTAACSTSLADRVRAELLQIREQVSGIYGSLVATGDGFLVAHDVPELEPAEIAALVATTRALSARTASVAGRGALREAVARGNLGYLAVYAAGDSAIVAVIGSNDLDIGTLHDHVRETVQRIAAHSPGFDTLTGSANTRALHLAPGQPAETSVAATPLPGRKATAG